MNAKQEKSFYEEFFKLQKKYPECAIVAWMPNDFQDRASKKLTKKDNLNIAGELIHNFDAEYGINWDVIDNIMGDLELNKHGIEDETC